MNNRNFIIKNLKFFEFFRKEIWREKYLFMELIKY